MKSCLKFIGGWLVAVLGDLARGFQDEVILFIRHLLNLLYSFLNQINFLLQLFGDRLNLRGALNVSKF